MPCKPRRRSWGSITTVARDKHVLRWVESTSEGRKRRSRTFHGTYREACLELDRLHVEHAADAPCPTVGLPCQVVSTSLVGAGVDLDVPGIFFRYRWRTMHRN